MNLLDVLTALIITILSIGIVAGVIHWGSEKNTQKAAAQQLALVSAAADRYIEANRADLLTQCTPTTGPQINLQTLVNDGFLPGGFTNRNVWNQNYAIYVRRIDTTVPDVIAGSGTTTEYSLRSVVMTTGGSRNTQKFYNATVPGAVSFLPAGGGYVPSGVVASQPANHLVGPGMQTALASLGIPSPGAGHLGIISDLSSAASGSYDGTTLSRVEVPGHPELNSMLTELDMSDHAIENVKELQFVPHTMAEMENFCKSPEDADKARIFKLENNGFYTCRDGQIHEILDTGNSMVVKDVRMVANGEVVPKPTCSPETGSTPEIYLAPAAMAQTTLDTKPITAFQTFAQDEGNGWRVIIRMQTPENKDGSWFYPSAAVAQSQATIFCRSPMMTP